MVFAVSTEGRLSRRNHHRGLSTAPSSFATSALAVAIDLPCFGKPVVHVTVIRAETEFATVGVARDCRHCNAVYNHRTVRVNTEHLAEDRQ